MNNADLNTWLEGCIIMSLIGMVAVLTIVFSNPRNLKRLIKKIF